MDDIIHFKKLLFGNNNLDFNNEIFQEYFTKQLKNYDYCFWLFDNYNIFINMNNILKYLNNIPDIKKYRNIDYVENITTNENIKYRYINDQLYKITKIRDSKKIDGFEIYIQKNNTNSIKVNEIPNTFNKEINKVYYKINDYIEIVINEYNELIPETNFIKINILNKHLWNDFIFVSLYKILYNLYTLVYKKSMVFSNYLLDKLKKYFTFDTTKEIYVTFQNFLNGDLLTSKDCNYEEEEDKNYTEPKIYYSYPIINKNDFYVLFNIKYNLIFTICKKTKNIDIIPLNNKDVWLKKEEELDIANNLKKPLDNYIFGAYVDYNNNKAYIYDIYFFENMRSQPYNMPYKQRYNYIDILLSKLPTSNFIFEKIEIIPLYSKEKIYNSFKYMINSNSIGVKYVSNDAYFSQNNYIWLYYQFLTIPFYVKDNDIFYKNDDQYIKINLDTEIKYKDERNYIFNYDTEKNKYIQSYNMSYDVCDESELSNFLKYIQYKYNPYDVVFENNFNISKSILWKLQLSYNCILIKSLDKIQKIYKKGYIPVVNDISLFNEFIKISDNSVDRQIGILYIDKWKCETMKIKDEEIKKIDICKKINIDKYINKYNNSFLINFDDYINLSCINNIPNVISLLILTLSKNTYIPLTPSQNIQDNMESKIIFTDLKTFAKHHKLRKNISILKKSEILELIQSSGYTLNDVKNFIEGEKIEKKKSHNDDDSESSSSEKQDNCENSEFTQYMYNDTEMEFYRKYVRQCTSQLKQTAFKRNLIESLEYNIDRKSLICLLVKKQCKSDTKMKPVVKKLKTKLQSIFPDETYQLISDIYKTDEQNYQCKGYNIINYKNVLLLRSDNNDIVEFLFLTSEGFNFLGNNEKDYIVRSFKSLVKNCIDASTLYNISNNNIFNIDNEFESSFKQIMTFELDKFYENENILQNIIIYSLFFGIYINIYEYTESTSIKLLFSSDKIPQFYELLKKYFSNDIQTYNVFIFSNIEKFDFGFNIKRVNNNIIFTYENLIR